MRFVCCVLLLTIPQNLLAQVTETFTTSTTVNHQTQFGSCNQITALLAASGSATISGNGKAVLSTPADADAVVLHSTNPLPTTYTLEAAFSDVAYNKLASGENGVSLLVVSNGIPYPGTSNYWLNRRLIGVELVSDSGWSNNGSIFINYWGAQNQIYTWNGTQWLSGASNWQPYFPITTGATYTVRLEKSATAFVITVWQGSTQMTQATIALASVPPVPKEYLAIGDRLNDYFHGSISLTELTMPAQCGGPDGGPVEAGPVEAGVVDASPEAGVMDVGLVEAGTVEAGVMDVGLEAGTVEAGVMDGLVEAGAVDVGPAEAGAVLEGGATVDAETLLDSSVGVDAGIGSEGGSQDYGNAKTDMPLYSPTSSCDCRVQGSFPQDGFVCFVLLGLLWWSRRRRTRR